MEGGEQEPGVKTHLHMYTQAAALDMVSAAAAAAVAVACIPSPIIISALKVFRDPLLMCAGTKDH